MLTDPCAFDNEKLVVDQPYELRFYPAFDYTQARCTLLEHLERFGSLPTLKVPLVARCQASIEKEGMRNPLIIEWYSKSHPMVQEDWRWLCTIGNNRYVALRNLGVTRCKALILYPTDKQVPPLSGDYEVVSFMSALSLFDATHAWWNSQALRSFCPSLAPKCV